MKRATLAGLPVRDPLRGWRMPRPRAQDLGLIAGLVVLVAFAAYFGWNNLEDSERARTSYNRVDRIRDIHGLGFQADDPHKLYVATHEGLIRGFHDRDWSRVGAIKDDIMGFAAHPTEPLTFFSSGHDGRANVGIRKTTDGGFTWTDVGLDGKDLHTIVISRANPDHLWASDGASALFASADGGTSWQPARSEVPTILSLTQHPIRAETLYAATPEGIQRSDDAGLSWRPLSKEVASSLVIHPSANDTIFAGTSGGVAVSRDGGLTWTQTTLDTDAPVSYLAIDPETPATIYAATSSGEIYKTKTSGATWERLVIE